MGRTGYKWDGDRQWGVCRGIECRGNEIDAETSLTSVKKDIPEKVITRADDEELRVLADAVLPARQQRRLRKLLQKNREGTLTPNESVELDALLEECDRIALLKAKALYALKKRSSQKGERKT